MRQNRFFYVLPAVDCVFAEEGRARGGKGDWRGRAGRLIEGGLAGQSTISSKRAFPVDDDLRRNNKLGQGQVGEWETSTKFCRGPSAHSGLKEP